MTAPTAHDQQIAVQLADAADAITMATFRHTDLRISTKPDRTPVTEADHAVESGLGDLLAQIAPSDAVFGEEYGWRGEPSERCWVIDPIDGTANYLRGVPVWATLIGLVVAGQPVLGMVTAPAMGRRWWNGPEGAWTSDPDGGVRALAVSAISDPADASVSYSDAVGWPPGALANLTRDVWRTRAFGDFWSHVLVAEGAVDVAAEPELAPWDVAALLPIVAAAGGATSGIDGLPALTLGRDAFAVPAGLLTTNGDLHEPFVARLNG